MDDGKAREQVKVEEELQDLKKELENFEKEKERVRAIVGKIGGVPKTQVRFVNQNGLLTRCSSRSSRSPSSSPSWLGKSGGC